MSNLPYADTAVHAHGLVSAARVPVVCVMALPRWSDWVLHGALQLSLLASVWSSRVHFFSCCLQHCMARNTQDGVLHSFAAASAECAGRSPAASLAFLHCLLAPVACQSGLCGLSRCTTCLLASLLLDWGYSCLTSLC